MCDRINAFVLRRYFAFVKTLQCNICKTGHRVRGLRLGPTSQLEGQWGVEGANHEFRDPSAARVSLVLKTSH